VKTSFRVLWRHHVDHVGTYQRKVYWWDAGSFRRLRVVYHVDTLEARIEIHLPGGNWKLIECRRWEAQGQIVSPAAAELLARAWMAEESARRFPLSVAVVDLVRLHNQKR